MGYITLNKPDYPRTRINLLDARILHCKRLLLTSKELGDLRRKLRFRWVLNV